MKDDDTRIKDIEYTITRQHTQRLFYVQTAISELLKGLNCKSLQHYMFIVCL